mmetsp:Transcript_24860/g.45015  ORF Transcript_24860/g.45015 Transcript_24860/m.45015 type:complete len:99 (+) Transcript_24860:1214-1510(+)
MQETLAMAEPHAAITQRPAPLDQHPWMMHKDQDSHACPSWAIRRRALSLGMKATLQTAQKLPLGLPLGIASLQEETARKLAAPPCRQLLGTVPPNWQS